MLFLQQGTFIGMVFCAGVELQFQQKPEEGKLSGK